MERVILFKMIGLLLLVVGVLAFIAGLLMANKFLQGTGFIGLIVAGALLYYSMVTTPETKPDEDLAFDEALKANTAVKK